MGLINKIFGTRSQREVKALTPIVDKIEALSDEYKALSDQQLRAKTDEIKARLPKGETLDDIQHEAGRRRTGCWACAPTGCSSSAASSSIKGVSPR